MGMFDEVRMLWPLPWPEVQTTKWQSKDTPQQYLDLYQIRKDGTLWHLAYDQRFEETDEAPFGFYLHRDNERWENCRIEGEIEVHEYVEHAERPGGYAYSVRFWFRDGKVADAIYEKHDTNPPHPGDTEENDGST